MTDLQLASLRFSEATHADWLDRLPEVLEEEMPKRMRCARCGQPRTADVHRKSYGSGSYSARMVNGELVAEVTTEGPYHAPWQHPYEPGMLLPIPGKDSA